MDSSGGEGAGEPRRGSNHLAAGDFLRGAGAIAVLVYHCAYVTQPTGGGSGPIEVVLDNLDLGLAVFFALSGYVIVEPLLRAWLHGEPAPSTARYLQRRLLRIVPPLWIITTGLVVLYLAMGGIGRVNLMFDNPPELAAVYLFAIPFVGKGYSVAMGPAWSLSVELTFYLAVAVVLATQYHRRPRRPVATVLALTAAVSVASLALRAALPATVAMRENLLTLAMQFQPGIALAVLAAAAGGLDAFAARARRRHVLALGALLLASTAAYATLEPGVHAVSPASSPLRAFLAAIVAGCVISIAAVRPRLASGVIAGAFAWLGVRSFTFYLVHQAVLAEIMIRVMPVLGLQGRLAPIAVTALGTTAISLVLAIVLHRAIEIPSMTWARRPLAIRPTLASLRPRGGTLVRPALTFAAVAVVVLLTVGVAVLPRGETGPTDGAPIGASSGLPGEPGAAPVETALGDPTSTTSAAGSTEEVADAPATDAAVPPTSEPAPAPSSLLRLLVVGDSTARALGMGLRDWGAATGKAAVSVVAQDGCTTLPAASVEVVRGVAVAQPLACRSLFADAAAEARRIQADAILVSIGTWQLGDLTIDGVPLQADIGDTVVGVLYATALRAALADLTATGAPVLWSEVPAARWPSPDGAGGSILVNDLGRLRALRALDATGLQGAAHAVALPIAGRIEALRPADRPDGVHLARGRVPTLADAWLWAAILDARRSAAADTTASAVETPVVDDVLGLVP